MSLADLQRFRELVLLDPELQVTLQRRNGWDAFSDALRKRAAELGLTVTEDDLWRLLADERRARFQQWI